MAERYLDVGCGMGSSSGSFGPDRRWVGLDIDPECVSVMRDKYPEHAFVVADAHRLPFPKDSFAGVTASHSLEHFDFPQKAMDELARVLIPGSEARVVVPHSMTEKRINPLEHGHVNPFENTGDLVEVAQNSGLEVEINKLIEVKENFFALEGRYSHAILLFYTVKKTGGKLLVKGNGHDSERAEYVDKKKLKSVALAPIFSNII